MSYQELIKDFSRIRTYMRDFYIFGFKTRDDYDAKSARSYDNERRRVESWLGEYMNFRRDKNGKQVFLSLDSRAAAHNPLYQSFRAKSFTDVDITLHFFILDLLSEAEAMSAREIADTMSRKYYAHFEEANIPDEATIRNKLKEYTILGLLQSRKRGQEVVYSLVTDTIPVDQWQDAIQFYTETMPLGVVGYYFKEKQESAFGFKHRYFLSALDNEIIYELLGCMEKHCAAEISVYTQSKEKRTEQIYPFKFFVSVQTGRQYLLAYSYGQEKMNFYRIGRIQSVKMLKSAKDSMNLEAQVENFCKHLWGTSTRDDLSLQHIEMDICVGRGEQYIVDRLEREKRNGIVRQISDEVWSFSTDVYDVREMLPWIRTFTGRILRLSSDNTEVMDTFNSDLQKLAELYGGDQDAVQ